MAAKTLSVYLNERLGTDISEQEVECRLNSHLIDHDDMISDDYQRFINNRAKTIHSEIIKTVANKMTQSG